MALTEDEVIQILKLVEQSRFDEFHLETGDLKLVIRKGGGAAIVREADPALANPEASPRVSVSEKKDHIPESGTSEGGKTEAKAEGEGLVPIKAPLLGVAYRRPAPESPPYVEVGSFVKEDDTVCLIEVMKVFTAVKAGVLGHIAEVLFDSGMMVEYGQPLFRVKPDAGSQ